MLKLSEQTASLQSTLARYCRNGEVPELEGALTSRLHHYRRLVFNVIEDALRTAYPLTVDLLPPKKWLQLVNSFFNEHNCQSYQVWRMPGEFFEFCTQQSAVDVKKYPFLNDLLLLEWKEVELFCMEDAVFPNKKSDSKNFVLNPEYEILSLNWPVHKVNARHITSDKKGQYFVLIFREALAKKVRFLELSIAHVLFLAGLEEFNGNADRAYEATALKLQLESKAFVEEQLAPFVAKLKSQGMLL